MKDFLRPNFGKVLYTILLLPLGFMIVLLVFTPQLNFCMVPSSNGSITSLCTAIGNNFDWLHFILSLISAYVLSSLVPVLYKKTGLQKKFEKKKGLKTFLTVCLICGLFFFSAFSIIFYFLMSMGIRNGITNESKPLVAAVLPYSEANGWESVADLNGAKGIDNQTPWYTKVFLTDQKPESVRDGLFTLLTNQGFAMKSMLHIPPPNASPYQITEVDDFRFRNINRGQPYWVVYGTTKSGNRVSVLLTDQVYDDNARERAVPPGMTAVTLHFTYEEARLNTPPLNISPTFYMIQPDPEKTR